MICTCLCNTAWPLRKLRQSILSGYKLLTWTDNDSVQKYMAPSVTFSLLGSLTQFPVKTMMKMKVGDIFIFSEWFETELGVLFDKQYFTKYAALLGKDILRHCTGWAVTDHSGRVARKISHN